MESLLTICKSLSRCPAYSVAVESTAVTSLVAVVCLLYVGVVCDNKVVLVTSTNWMLGHYWRCVIHTLANFGHCVLLQVGIILLVR